MLRIEELILWSERRMAEMWYLMGEIAVLLALAACLGLFVGWLLWGRRRDLPVKP